MEWYERLKQARLNKKITLKKISNSEEYIVSQQSMIKYEKGEIYPPLNILLKLCDLYGVTLDYIVYGNDHGICTQYPLQKQLELLFSLRHDGLVMFDNISGKTIITDRSINKYMRILEMLLDDNQDKKDFEIVKEMLNYLKNIKE